MNRELQFKSTSPDSINKQLGHWEWCKGRLGYGIWIHADPQVNFRLISRSSCGELLLIYLNDDDDDKGSRNESMNEESASEQAEEEEPPRSYQTARKSVTLPARPPTSAELRRRAQLDAYVNAASKMIEGRTRARKSVTRPARRAPSYVISTRANPNPATARQLQRRRQQRQQTPVTEHNSTAARSDNRTRLPPTQVRLCLTPLRLSTRARSSTFASAVTPTPAPAPSPPGSVSSMSLSPTSSFRSAEASSSSSAKPSSLSPLVTVTSRRPLLLRLAVFSEIPSRHRHRFGPGRPRQVQGASIQRCLTCRRYILLDYHRDPTFNP